MTSKEMLLDVKKRNETLKREGHFHIGEIAMKVIEKLVERDTPMKIIDIGFDNHGIIRTCICPVCHQWLTFTEKENFCPKCGQRLDWSD